MGLVVPRISPFIYQDTNVADPGIIFLVMQLATPIGALGAGYISDRTLKIRSLVFWLTVILALAIGAISLIPLVNEGRKALSVIGWFFFGLGMGGVVPLMNVAFLQSGNKAHRFGRVRLFGTLGFLLPNILLTFLVTSNALSLQLAAIFYLLSLTALFYIPRHRVINENHPGSTISIPAMLRYMRSKVFVLFLLIMFFFFFGFAPAEYIIGNYIDHIPVALFNSIEVEAVPFSWFIATVIEIGFFYISEPLLRKHSAIAIVGIGLGAGMVRHLALIVMQPDAGIVWMQGLHGLHFSPGYLGSLLFIEEKAWSRHLATAQALLVIAGRAMGTGIGGYILGNMAANGEYNMVFSISLAASAMGAAMLIFYTRYQKRFKHFLTE